MDNLGEYIRCQRESKKMTIEELSQKTKISVAVLKDIENGKFDRYKGDEAYVKMYLKKITNVLNLDTESVTQQYVELTREIAMEDLQEKADDNLHHGEEIVKKGKKFSFEAPQFARKPSVYEDKSHVTIIRATIILVLVCLVIVVVWYGIYSTRTQTEDPSFKEQNQTTVEGDVNTDDQPTDNNSNQNQTNSTENQIVFTRNGLFDFNFKLPEGTEKFTFKIEFANESWASLTVNNKQYKEFKSDIYHADDSQEFETVELEFTASEFQTLRLRVGYGVGQRYYINNQEVPLTEEDAVYGAASVNLTLEK